MTKHQSSSKKTKKKAPVHHLHSKADDSGQGKLIVEEYKGYDIHILYRPVTNDYVWEFKVVQPQYHHDICSSIQSCRTQARKRVDIIEAAKEQKTK